ncbi:MAG: cache domain-containing protein, partial [Spirochaetales bacterium]|nr:cache domain-containing protein [Spirochaetales bacterium]
MIRKRGIQFRIMSSIFLMSTLTLFACIAVLEMRNNRTILLAMDNTISLGRQITFSQVEEEENSALRIAHQYAENSQLLEAFATDNREILAAQVGPIFQTLSSNNGVTVFEFGDSTGKVFLRGHNPGKFGDDKSEDPAIRAALEGRDIAGFIFGSSGLAIRAIIPLRAGTDIAGTLQVGFNLNQELLSGISRLVGEIAFYEKDKLVQSTSADDLETEHNEEEIFARLSEGEEAVIIDRNSVKSTFLPMHHPVSGDVQGMFRLDQDISFLSQRRKENYRIYLLIVCIMTMLVLVISFVISRGLVRSVKSISETLMGISEDRKLDLSRNFTVNSKDEVGDMADSLSLSFQKIRDLVTLVKNQSVVLREVGENLSANMTETAAAVNEIVANIQSVKKQAGNQAASVSETSSTMEQVSGKIENLNSLIEDQAANVTESS